MEKGHKEENHNNSYNRSDANLVNLMYLNTIQGKMDITNKILMKNSEDSVLDIIQNKDQRCALRRLISEMNTKHGETKVEAKKKTRRLNLTVKDTKEEK